MIFVRSFNFYFLNLSSTRSADSGLQLDLEIALSGASAKVQPHSFLSPAEDALKRRVT
jgi:hypothetical protein